MTTEPTPVIFGATYTQVATGLSFKLAGLRTGNMVALYREISGADPEIIDRLPISAFQEQFRHDGCDHDQHCCTEHGTHTAPHRGCVLR